MGRRLPPLNALRAFEAVARHLSITGAAEELGVTSKNVDEMLKSTNPEIKRLLGTEGEFGKGIGLDNDWVARIVKGVGNYGEIYERNVEHWTVRA